MPRASEVQGKEGKLACWTQLGDGPSVCGATLSIAGEVQCPRCKKKRSYAELAAHAVRNNVLDGGEFLYDFEKKLHLWEDTPQHARIREMYRENFIGVPELGWVSRDKEGWGRTSYHPTGTFLFAYLKYLHIPFSPEQLAQHKDTHILLYMPPIALTLSDLRLRWNSPLADVYDRDNNYYVPFLSEHPFAKRCSVRQPGWYLVGVEQSIFFRTEGFRKQETLDGVMLAILHMSLPPSHAFYAEKRRFWCADEISRGHKYNDLEFLEAVFTPSDDAATPRKLRFVVHQKRDNGLYVPLISPDP